MTRKSTAAVLEAGRRLAVELLGAGLSIGAVAALLGVSRVSLWRWRNGVARGGPEALAARAHPGARPRLSIAQQQELVRMLQDDPTVHGWPTSLWTSGRVARLIARHFGVQYHPAHVWRLLIQLGLSKQKPQSLARERDEEAIARWRSVRWPLVKKRPGGSDAGSWRSMRSASCSSRPAAAPGPCGAERRRSRVGTAATAAASSGA